jgi:predicted metal-dependent phosphoesterase TrpH
MSIEKIIDIAESLNLEIISITDHDTISGVQEAINLVKGKKIKLVPGIEINTEYRKKEVHILGYFIDIFNHKLVETIEYLRNERVNRVKKIITKLNQLNISITFEDVLEQSKGESIGRPHIALAMIKKGYGKTVGEIFDEYIDQGKPAYVERFKLSPYDAINLIRDANGIAVLAHPKLVKDEDIVNELLPHVDGLEVFHSEHTEEDSNYYLNKALQHNLIVTGGSDCHGIGKGKELLLGTVKIPKEYISAFEKIYKERERM